MRIDVVLLPEELRDGQVSGRAVAVLDVLRATTTMAAALSAGVRELRIFESISVARDAAMAARQRGEPALVCGEERCLPPPGFDLGNSPGAFRPEQHAGRVAFMCTTNGTRAILAARGAAAVYVAALVNAAASAEALLAEGRDLTLLCAGTTRRMAMEDILGAGAVIEELRLRTHVELDSDAARIAQRLFMATRHDLRSVLADAQGGRNVLSAGLEQDIDFAARLNVLNVAGRVMEDPPRVVAWRGAHEVHGEQRFTNE
jgi:2-phosphosulfolactate phosphatase